MRSQRKPLRRITDRYWRPFPLMRHSLFDFTVTQGCQPVILKRQNSSVCVFQVFIVLSWKFSDEIVRRLLNIGKVYSAKNAPPLYLQFVIYNIGCIIILSLAFATAWQLLSVDFGMADDIIDIFFQQIRDDGKIVVCFQMAKVVSSIISTNVEVEPMKYHVSSW